MNANASDSGIEYSTPSNPNHIGSNNANPTPKITSRTMDSIVDVTGLPSDCRKINAALFIQAGISKQRYTRKDLTAKSV